jgi:pimeloyl-ACP methyl ester carboxylesterase
MNIIRVDDLTVLHEAPEVATHPPVLFVHGYFVDASIWTEWVRYFAARGTPSYAVNLRGRAGSRPGTDLGAATIDDFVEDAALVSRRVGARVVVGQSMGGLIAQKLAERGNVAGTVLITPAPPKGISVLSPRVALRQLRYLPALFRSQLVRPAREDLRDLVMNHIPASQQDGILDRMVADSGRAGRDMSITGVRVDAARIKTPMLVVASADDRFIPRRIVERVAHRYGAPLYVAEGHGHLVLLEPGWEDVAAHIHQWIAAL